MQIFQLLALGDGESLFLLRAASPLPHSESVAPNSAAVFLLYFQRPWRTPSMPIKRSAQ